MSNQQTTPRTKGIAVVLLMVLGAAFLISLVWLLVGYLEDQFKPIAEQILQKYEGSNKYANGPTSARIDRLKATLSADDWYNFRYEYIAPQDKLITEYWPVAVGLIVAAIASFGVGALILSGLIWQDKPHLNA